MEYTDCALDFSSLINVVNVANVGSSRILGQLGMLEIIFPKICAWGKGYGHDDDD